MILVLGARMSARVPTADSSLASAWRPDRGFAIVDADIGQKNIGLPATLTFAYIAGAVDHGRWRRKHSISWDRLMRWDGCCRS